MLIFWCCCNMSLRVSYKAQFMSGLKRSVTMSVILIWCSLVSVYKPFILYVCCLIVVVLHLLFRNVAEYWHYISHKYKSLKRWCEMHRNCEFRVTDESFKWDSSKNLIQDTAQVYINFIAVSCWNGHYCQLFIFKQIMITGSRWSFNKDLHGG